MQCSVMIQKYIAIILTKSRKLKTVFHFCSSKVEDLPFSTPRVHVSNVGVFLNFHDDD